jgi:tRNA-splicing ligase RtcB
VGDAERATTAICEKHPRLGSGAHGAHLGTLGTGNHFIEVCLDESSACG